MGEEFSSNQTQAGGKPHERMEHAAEHVKRQASGAAHAARGKSDTAANHAGQRVHQAADAGAQDAHRVTEKAADWRQCGSLAADHVRGQANSLLDNALEYVHERPAQSLAITLAAGWLAGWLMARRY